MPLRKPAAPPPSPHCLVPRTLPSADTQHGPRCLRRAGSLSSASIFSGFSGGLLNFFVYLPVFLIVADSSVSHQFTLAHTHSRSRWKGPLWPLWVRHTTTRSEAATRGRLKSHRVHSCMGRFATDGSDQWPRGVLITSPPGAERQPLTSWRGSARAARAKVWTSGRCARAPALPHALVAACSVDRVAQPSQLEWCL